MNNIKVIPAMSADLAGAKNPANLGYVSLIETPHLHGYFVYEDNWRIYDPKR
jgi:hypothetical protein